MVCVLMRALCDLQSQHGGIRSEHQGRAGLDCFAVSTFSLGNVDFEALSLSQLFDCGTMSSSEIS